MKPVWTTASEDDIPVQEMIVHHLLNTIGYLENFAERAKNEYHQRWLSYAQLR